MTEVESEPKCLKLKVLKVEVGRELLDDQKSGEVFKNLQRGFL